jgi:hypothetical protein
MTFKASSKYFISGTIPWIENGCYGVLPAEDFSSARASGNASTGQHKFLERVVWHGTKIDPRGQWNKRACGCLSRLQ